MADLVITAANVVPGTNAIIDRAGFAGETITAGKAVYMDSTSKKWQLADSNSATVEQRKATGIALNGASLNQPVDVHKFGDITIGATLTPGIPYYLSDTPGGICVVADVGVGEYICMLGLAKSASVIAVDIQFPGVSN